MDFRNLERLIVFNGPPSAGKDESARIIMRLLRDAPGGGIPAFKAAFANELKIRTHLLFGLFVKRGKTGAFELCGFDEAEMPAPADFFEDRKDKPAPEFMGKTPRQAYIATAEKLLRPNFGIDIFAKFGLKTIAEMLREGPAIAIVTDLGFDEEAKLVVDNVPADKITYIQIHRPGYDYSSDSRTYVEMPNPDIKKDVIFNDRDTDKLEFNLMRILARDVFEPRARVHSTSSVPSFGGRGIS